MLVERQIGGIDAREYRMSRAHDACLVRTPMATHENLGSARLAFIGALAPDCPTRELFLGLIVAGHQVIPICAGVSEVGGQKAYASLQLAGELDGVVIMTSQHDAEQALLECILARLGPIWLIGDVIPDPRGFATRHALDLVVLRDPIAALDHAQGLLRRITGRLRRLASARCLWVDPRDERTERVVMGPFADVAS